MMLIRHIIHQTSVFLKRRHTAFFFFLSSSFFLFISPSSALPTYSDGALPHQSLLPFSAHPPSRPPDARYARSAREDAVD